MRKPSNAKFVTLEISRLKLLLPLLETKPPSAGEVFIENLGQVICLSCGQKDRKHVKGCKINSHWDALQELEKILSGAKLIDWI